MTLEEAVGVLKFPQLFVHVQMVAVRVWLQLKEFFLRQQVASARKAFVSKLQEDLSAHSSFGHELIRLGEAAAGGSHDGVEQVADYWGQVWRLGEAQHSVVQQIKARYGQMVRSHRGQLDIKRKESIRCELDSALPDIIKNAYPSGGD